MIDTLACAGGAFNEERFTQAALKAAHFLKTTLWKEGRLLRRYRDGESKYHASLPEYAYLIKGVLSLFEQGLGTHWLEWAMEMAGILEQDFKVKGGAFYQTDGKEQMIIRKCEFYDGSEPSGNGVHCENLLRLHQITQEESYLNQAEDILKSANEFIEAYPPGACYSLMALQRYLDKKRATVVVSLNDQETNLKEISTKLATQFLPHVAIIWKRPKDELLDKLIPESADKLPVDGKTAVYICRQNVCQAPKVTDEEIINLSF